MAKPTKTIEELRETANRRAKRWQQKQRDQGKKHLNVMVHQGTMDLIAEQREKTGATTTEIVERAIDAAYGSPEPGLIPIEPEPLDKILLDVADEPGTWKDKADRLNEQGIKTAKGKTWTDANIRIAVSKIKKRQDK